MGTLIKQRIRAHRNNRKAFLKLKTEKLSYFQWTETLIFKFMTETAGRPVRMAGCRNQTSWEYSKVPVGEQASLPFTPYKKTFFFLRVGQEGLGQETSPPTITYYFEKNSGNRYLKFQLHFKEQTRIQIFICFSLGVTSSRMTKAAKDFQ